MLAEIAHVRECLGRLEIEIHSLRAMLAEIELDLREVQPPTIASAEWSRERDYTREA